MFHFILTEIHYCKITKCDSMAVLHQQAPEYVQTQTNSKCVHKHSGHFWVQLLETNSLKFINLHAFWFLTHTYRWCEWNSWLHHKNPRICSWVSSLGLNLFKPMYFTSTNTNNSTHTLSLSRSRSVLHKHEPEIGIEMGTRKHNDRQLRSQWYHTDTSAIASGSINPFVPGI